MHPHPADLEIIAADILVARGMERLAPTPAAVAAVEVVREFGRHEADRRDGADRSAARPLETSIVDLAVTVGAALGESAVAVEVEAWVAGLETTAVDDFPEVSILIDESPREPYLDGVPTPQVAKDGVRSGATDTD